MKGIERAIIADELEKLRSADGLLRPVVIVKSARRKESPLHNRFTWNDGEAANLYRLEEARRLIRVIIFQEIKEIPSQRVFVSLTSDRVNAGGGYRALVDVMSDTSMYARMRSDAMTLLGNAREKYRRVVELEKVWEAIDEVVQEDVAA